MEIKNIGQLISHLATKAGILATDPNLMNILSNAELSKVPIHSDLVKGIDESLVPLSAAVDNHPVIGPKYRAQALNQIDTRLTAVIDELEVDDAEKARLKGIRNTYERQDAVLAKIKEQKTAAGGDGDKSKAADGLKKQVDDLAKKLQDAEAAKTQAVASVEGLRKGDRIKFDLFKKLYTKKTIYDDLDPEVKESSIEAIVNKALQDGNAEFTYDENGNFTIMKKDGSKFLSAAHKDYTPDSFLDETLATKKILVVSNTGQQHQQQQNQFQQQQQGYNQQGNNQQQQQYVNGNNGQQQTIGTNQSVADFNESQLASPAATT